MRIGKRFRRGSWPGPDVLISTRWHEWAVSNRREEGGGETTISVPQVESALITIEVNVVAVGIHGI